jgi:DNA-binding transcriptional LysR family regulator
MRFDLTDLRLIVRIAELNSITKGAKASFMSLPAASMRIKRLEENAEAALIIRANRGVTLTPAGQTLVHHARLVLNQIDQLEGDLKEYTKGATKRLRVLANMPALEFLPVELHRYVRTHPDVNLDLREAFSHDIVRLVTLGHADIGIVAGTVRTENLETFLYHRERLTLVVSPQHPLAKASSVNFMDTIEYDHVGLHEAGPMQVFLRQIVDPTHRPFRLRIQVGHYETLCRMIEINLGVGIVPESVARRHAQTMSLCIVPLNDEWALRNMRICVRKRDELPDFGRDLLNVLVVSARTPRKKTRP